MDTPGSDETRRSIAEFLRAQLGAQSVEVAAVDVAGLGHSAENWRVSVRVRDADGVVTDQGFVFRRQSSGRAWDSPRDQEFRFLRIINDRTDIPAPEAVWFDDSLQYLDTPFIVERLLEGSADYDLFRDERRSTRARTDLFNQFLETLIKIHTVDWQALDLDFLGPRYAVDTDGTPVPYFDPAGRELFRVRRRLDQLNGRFESSSSVDNAFAWLAAHKPEPGKLCLVHADYGPHNTLLVGDRLHAVLDWEFAIISDPVQDVAWFTLRGRSIRDNFDQNYYTVEEFRRAYTARTGYSLDLDALRWWQVFGLCRTVVGRLIMVSTWLR